MSDYIWCHGTKCHTNHTQDRIRGVQGSKVLRTRKIKQDEVNENYGRMQSGLTWFQKNNVDAYYKLLD